MPHSTSSRAAPTKSSSLSFSLLPCPLLTAALPELPTSVNESPILHASQKHRSHPGHFPLPLHQQVLQIWNLWTLSHLPQYHHHHPSPSTIVLHLEPPIYLLFLLLLYIVFSLHRKGYFQKAKWISVFPISTPYTQKQGYEDSDFKPDP